MRKQQKHEHKLNMLRATGIMTAAVLGAAAVLVIFLVKPGRSQAGSSFKIDGNGTLLSYDVSDGMTQVVIPDTVTAIGTGAFLGDNTLEKVSIPPSVKIIGDKAFYRCSHLTEVYIQEGTEEVQDSAFGMCTNLSTATLPASLKTMGDGVFAGDSSLYQVTLADGNSAFFLNDGVIYNNDSTEIVQFVPGRKGDVYEMPFTVTSIRPYAFWGANNLKKVYVSNQVTEIPNFAFTNSAALEFVFLPNSVLSVKEYAFRDCKKMVYVGAESTFTTADKSSFEGAEELTAEVGVSKADAETRYLELLSGHGGSGDGKSGAADSDDMVNENGALADKNSRIIGTPWGISAPYKEIDTSESNLYGYGKIVGGSTLIMPTGNVSGGSVSGN